jgi:hypothetical protein
VSADKGDSDGGEMGHIMALNDVLDRTEPGHMGMSSKEAAAYERQEAKLKAKLEAEEKRYQELEKNPNAVSAEQGNALINAAAEMSKMPVASGTWSLDLDPTTIPEGRASGMISGTNFVVDNATLVKVGPVRVLVLSEGTNGVPERQIILALTGLSGAEATNSWSIYKEMKGKEVPVVTKQWKTNPRFAPTAKKFNTGYAMELQLSEPTNSIVSGKIALSLPDKEQSFVMGQFKAAMITPGSLATP